nr:hypothetical protein [Tanacetum cinerariifolium]
KRRWLLGPAQKCAVAPPAAPRAAGGPALDQSPRRQRSKYLLPSPARGRLGT